MKRFRGGLVLEAHRLLYHSTLGLRVIKKKKKCFKTWRPLVFLFDAFTHLPVERELFIDNLLVIIVMIRWTGLAPWESEFTLPGSLTSPPAAATVFLFDAFTYLPIRSRIQGFSGFELGV